MNGPSEMSHVVKFQPKFYKYIFSLYFMAVSPPNPRKRKLDYNVDQATYDEFAKACSRKGLAPQIIVEQAMRKFVQEERI